MSIAKYLVMSLALVPVTGTAEEPQLPQTIELPSAAVQRVMQFLVMDRGGIAVSILREINDCLQLQGPVQVHIGGQQDLCPAVTASVKARADATAKAIQDATKAAKKSPDTSSQEPAK